MELLTVSAYAREVRPLMPDAAFEPARSRVLWVPVHYTIVALVVWALASDRVPWPLWPLASLVIGCCMAGVVFGAFRAHVEILTSRPSSIASFVK